MSDFATARKNMIDRQLLPNRVGDDRIVEAMSTIPREEFMSKSMQGIAYMDEDIDVSDGRIILKPVVFARLIQAADIGPDDAVLDVGCVTGYSSAILSHLANVVVALEETEEAAQDATDRLASQGIDNVVVFSGSLKKGYVEQAPYDVIVLEGSVAEVPECLLAQLTDGGRLVAIVANGTVGSAILYSKVNGVIGHLNLFDASARPLPGFDRVPEFEF